MSDNNCSSFVISEEDWSLHRKGFEDQVRHEEKISETIRNNLPNLITEENIVMSNGEEVVRVPIKSLEQYKIRYNDEKNQHTGQAGKNSEVGDVITSSNEGGDKRKASGAGAEIGEDYYDVEVSLLDIEEALFEQLQLPYLKKKQLEEQAVNDFDFNDIRSNGLAGNIDKKRTILSALKRNALVGKQHFQNIHKEDLKFKTWNDVKKPYSKAVVIAMMDTSGSMGLWEKYMARSFFFWMNRFLKTKYEHVEIKFIAHHTEAKLVSVEHFFTKGESGGTICSSVYRKALQLIEEQYNEDDYNIYSFHFSDGDNLTSDNERCLKLVKELIEKSNLFGYGEVNQYNRSSTLMSAYKKLTHERFRHYILKNKADVYNTMRHFFKSS